MSALSIQGVSSNAGKSVLTTALARAFARRGVRVAPFKAQNMSNNARVVSGGEIGVAQYLQALAAGIEPDVRMNPILVKPEGDNRSQLVLLGKVDRQLSRASWLERPPSLWPVAEQALRELLAEYDLVLLEGAGSPAETNLRASDLANMRAAHAADAPVVLVADIDRGGAFAHLHGTWSLVTNEDRARLHGFVLNRFRGDPGLLEPAPHDLERSTGMRYLGWLPFVDHGLPDEDGAATPTAPVAGVSVGVVRYPTASNLDELKLLEQVAAVSWIGRPEEVDDPTLLVLPGSKHVAADLDWLRATGIAARIVARAAAGKPVLGICGGLQMLGGTISDPDGVDGERDGLGLLPVSTAFAAEKRTAMVRVRFGKLAPPFAALSGVEAAGYDIRHGETSPVGSARAADAEERAFQAGPVLGLASHGVLASPDVLVALVGARPARDLEGVFEGLADLVEQQLDLEGLARVAGIG
ncbi:MAG: cobyric acid synthase [Gaiellales bacterium]